MNPGMPSGTSPAPRPLTVTDLEHGIRNALADGNVRAAVDTLEAIAGLDLPRAAQILSVLETAIDTAHLLEAIGVDPGRLDTLWPASACPPLGANPGSDPEDGGRRG